MNIKEVSMKRYFSFISVLFAAFICLCFTITAFADERNYTIDFTREEAYEAVMNTSPVAAENLYGGKEAYYEALTDADKEQLFDMMWNLTESGILYEDTGINTTIHVEGFVDDYFSTVIHAFSGTDTSEEGLQNLRTRIGEINEEYFAEDSPEYEKVDTVEKTEPAETQASDPDASTLAATTAEETLPVTTAPEAEPQQGGHPVLTVILCIVLVCAAGAAGYAGYLFWQNKKQS